MPWEPGTATSPTTSISGSFSTSAYRTFLDGQVTTSYSSTDLYIDRINDDFYFNRERTCRDALRSFNNYFQMANFDYVGIAHGLTHQYPTYTGQTISMSDYPDFARNFYSTQVSYMNTYFNNMLNATDAASSTNYYNQATATLANNLKLTTDMKKQVQVIFDTCNKFAQAYFGGKYTLVVIDLNDETEQAASGCAWDWRDIFLGAVVSGAVAGTSGAIYGASGGTVVVPGLGTATGGVAGAVVGFAGGFAAGVAEGIVVEYMKCLRNSVQGEPRYMCQQLEYGIAHPDECTQEYMDLKTWFLING